MLVRLQMVLLPSFKTITMLLVALMVYDMSRQPGVTQENEILTPK
jgi:hypothetical protein